jgi:hypothetical protein
MKLITNMIAGGRENALACLEEPVKSAVHHPVAPGLDHHDPLLTLPFPK